MADALPLVTEDMLPLVIADTLSLVVAEAPPLAVAEASPLALADTIQLVVTDTLPLVVTDALSLAVAETLPLAVADALPLAVADALPLAVADALPLAVQVNAGSPLCKHRPPCTSVEFLTSVLALPLRAKGCQRVCGLQGSSTAGLPTQGWGVSRPTHKPSAAEGERDWLRNTNVCVGSPHSLQ